MANKNPFDNGSKIVVTSTSKQSGKGAGLTLELLDEYMAALPRLSPSPFELFRQGMTRDISVLFGLPPEMLEPKPRSSFEEYIDRWHEDLRVSASMSYADYSKSLGDVRVYQNPFMTEPVVDWSNCRSPGRARRRAARGFKQHTRVSQRPLKVFVALPDGSLVCHPALWAELQATLARQLERHAEGLAAAALTGKLP